MSGSERVNEFEHENWERVGNIAGQVENWAKEFISAKWDRPVQSKITISTQKNIVFYYG